MRDLLFVARIVDAADRAGVKLERVDSAAELPEPADVDLVLVDWADRALNLASELKHWRDAPGGAAAPRLVLFGSHVDLGGHAEARRHGLGPVMARSAFVQRLDTILAAR